ncbi:MAG TPA: NAD(P)/FAD-dependent oxidoreductase [Gemmatimonadales bacterium]|nr:NAD(P)/FAD-dependent oxidoreductase [Gemmatimonadales bacterium]
MSPAPSEMLDAVVIGGAQAGLAAGHELARRDLRFVVLEAAARVGDGWRARWDSLRLFTPARYSGLPGLPFPAAPYHLPAKDEVADYLEGYARHFALPVRTGARVAAVRAAGDAAGDAAGFVVETAGETFRAANVIVATGAAQVPRVPACAAALDPAIVQLHSSAYRNPAQLPAGDVLVVGAGNSGAQIALELAAARRGTARVLLAGRDTGAIPRRFLGRDIYDWLWPIGGRIDADSRLGRRMRSRMTGGDPLVGIRRDEIARAGIRRTGRVAGVRDGRPLLDGAAGGNEVEALDVAAIVWCTGYGNAYPWLEPFPVTDTAGRPVHRRGVTVVPGLYFLGLRFQTNPRSSLIGGVGNDARAIVEHLARRPMRRRLHEASRGGVAAA